MLRMAHFEGVRSFRSRREIPASPLTLVVGENSSGKSTFLAMLRAAWSLIDFEDPNFNESPFALGSYDSIAHYHGGRGKRVAQFKIGLAIDGMGRSRKKPESLFKFEATFGSRLGHPSIQNWSVEQGARRLELDLNTREASFHSSKGVQKKTIEIPTQSLERLPRQLLRHQLALAFFPERVKKIDDDLMWLQQAFYGFGLSSTGRPRAIAPIRTHPKRTYDAVRDQPSPEGEHVPALLSRHHADPNSSEWTRLAKEIKRFGNDSGLFNQLEVRHLAKKAETGPFQLEFSMIGQQGKRNILDLGYGVSQVLPILVECLANSRDPLLLQQPEVHLHPKAQAELGTFLARIAKNGQRQLIVETHSDHLIDRVLMSVRDGDLVPDDVRLLFFEMNSGETVVHDCPVNVHGAVQAPDSYRDFFLREQARVLGL